MTTKSPFHQIALLLVSGIGIKLTKVLVANVGSAEAIFDEKPSHLLKIPGISKKLVAAIHSKKTWPRAEKELLFIEKHGIETHFYMDDSYPNRLKFCEDAPIMLFSKGNIDWNPKRSIAIVGTRKPTTYGLDFIQNFLEDLSPLEVTIVSGLAYGIDIQAHRMALANRMPTWGVIGHGLDRIYPGIHRNVAKDMMNNGGLITEFMSGTRPDRENFPKRNRIIAGLADATLVVESWEKGGSLITAHIANSYHRDVFAVPGSIHQTQSLGCNQLIHRQQATLIRNAEDVVTIMNWQTPVLEKPIQQELFPSLDSGQMALLEAIPGHETISLDELSYQLQTPVSILSAMLLTMEFMGLVKSLPGKCFRRA
jgi:DNA processing protein